MQRARPLTLSAPRGTIIADSRTPIKGAAQKERPRRNDRDNDASMIIITIIFMCYLCSGGAQWICDKRADAALGSLCD